jgi:diguanylate cyclase (GGDEF)-like protein
MLTYLLILLIGGVAGWLARARAREGSVRAGLATRPVAGPELLPEPALRWLMRAHGALGVWLAERVVGDDDPVIERVIDVDRLAVSDVVALDRRVESARDSERSGVERLDAGTLVIRTGHRLAVALLVPPDVSPGAELDEDLDRLLEGLKRRPEAVALAQARPERGAIESVGSVALRLAHQLERTTNGAVVVVSVEPDGVRVVGVSGHADRRLLEKFITPECDLDKVARGALGRMIIRGDPLGGAASDRRQRPVLAQLEPIMGQGRTPCGAVALWLPGGVELTGPRLAEILESIREAGPRLAVAQQHAAAERGAFTDPLTGLANRAELQRAMHRANLAGGALIALDLDHFKKVNDGLGHAAGDAALIHLAAVLRDQVRGMDTVARVGGEEFVIWLPDASLDVGVMIAQRVRSALASRVFEWQGTTRPLTASFGVAACPDTSRAIDNLMVQADQALYRAKEEGRDRVVAAERVR